MKLCDSTEVGPAWQRGYADVAAINTPSLGTELHPLTYPTIWVKRFTHCSFPPPCPEEKMINPAGMCLLFVEKDYEITPTMPSLEKEAKTMKKGRRA